MRTLGIGAALFVLGASLPTQAAYYNYSTWEALPESYRAAYIAGAFDSLVGFAVTDADTIRGKHYSECPHRAKMKDGQLAENIRAFARARPSLHSQIVQGAMIQYLIELCGTANVR